MGRGDVLPCEAEAKVFYNSITTRPKLFISVFSAVNSKAEVKDEERYSTELVLDFENFVLLLIIERYLIFEHVDVHFIKQDLNDLNDALNTIFVKYEVEFKELAFKRSQFVRIVKLPCVELEEKNLSVGGLSSVLRFLIKFVWRKLESCGREDANELKSLLGFRTSCLQNCAGTSAWTKFCEVDLFNMVEDLGKAILNNPNNLADVLKIPKDLITFELTLRQPPRLVNSRKVALKNLEIKDKKLKCLNMEEIRDAIPHDYAEGPSVLISDLIIFPSINFALALIGQGGFNEFLPYVSSWLHRVRPIYNSIRGPIYCYRKIHQFIPFPSLLDKTNTRYEIPPIDLSNPHNSLYRNEPNRHKPRSSQFTKQEDIDEGIHLLLGNPMSSNGPIHLIEEDVGEEREFNWAQIPLDAHPEKGNLPSNRLEKKKGQLGSLALAIEKLVGILRTKDIVGKVTIVDFCSGGGHLGIVLAVYLNDVDVILVENKEESNRRAEERVSRLKLQNVRILQSNMDYFTGDFHIGVGLHACGVASDLILEKCERKNAAFVVSPCCYGKIGPNHIIDYPRSGEFEKLRGKLFFALAHAADQTHEAGHEKTPQGNLAMRIIDTDRAYRSYSKGYELIFKKIKPENASPKNHILIGFKK